MIHSEEQRAVHRWFAESETHLVCDSYAGCLSGDTEIAINRAKKGWTLSLRELVAKFNGEPFIVTRKDGSTPRAARAWDSAESTFVQRREGDVVRLGRIVKAWASGVKVTYVVTTEAGRSVRATDEHPFLTPDGWRRLDNLRPGSLVSVRGCQRLHGLAPKRLYPTLSGLWHHPHAARQAPTERQKHGVARVPLQRLVMEAQLNLLPFDEFLNLVFAGEVARLTFIDPAVHVVHHKDRNPYNNATTNLELMSCGEHKRLHAMEGTDENVLFKVVTERVASVVRFGEEETFDIEVADEPHNFMANGFVVHNSGKTTTILEGIEHAPEQSIFLAAFAKRNELDFKARLQNPRAITQTIHAAGLGIVTRYWGYVKVDERARQKWLTETVCGPDVPNPIRTLVTKLAKVGRELAPLATVAGELSDLAEQYDCVPDAEWEAEGWGSFQVCQLAVQAMELAALEKPTHLDYADMLFLPVRKGWIKPRYDLVVVDECQDLTRVQLQIAMGVCMPGGRIALVGDRRQAIYAWRGAAIDSMAQMRDTLAGTPRGVSDLKLTTTYRCPRIVTRLAQQLVHDFKHGDDNPEGTLRQVPDTDALVRQADPGDLVLSRTNAPLLGVAMSLLRARKRVAIAGRDISGGLTGLIKKLAPSGYTTLDDFCDRLARWEVKEIDRAKKADREERIPGIEDKAETLRVLSEGLETTQELLDLLMELFSDMGAGGPDVVTCSTVHKAKGGEAPRVWVLAETLHQQGPCGSCRHFHGRGKGCYRCECLQHVTPTARAQEELNIEYVALTRSLKSLVLVGKYRRILPCGENDARDAAGGAESLPFTGSRVTETA